MTTRSKKKIRRTKSKEPIAPVAPSAFKYPDFAARSKQVFGDRVLNAVEDFLKYRHRDWEQ